MAKRKTEEDKAAEAKLQAEMDAIDSPIELIEWFRQKKRDNLRKTERCFNEIIRLLKEPWEDKEAADDIARQLKLEF